MAHPIVFLCRCFGEIEEVIDIPELRDKLASGAPVSSVRMLESLCLEDDLKKVASIIRDSGEERALIAACSRLSRGDSILGGLSKEGINTSHIELVDIREGCAWIHGGDPTGASQKAFDLIYMGLASLEHKWASKDAWAQVCPEALILGAGPAGLSDAYSLARLGFQTHLVESSEKPGGMLNLISRLFPGDETGAERLKPYLDELEDSPLIRFYPKSRMVSIEGVMGDFRVRVAGPEGDCPIRAGVIIVATGSRPVIPHGLFKYGELKNVITQMELERRLKTQAVEAKKVVFIQCVGARDQYRPYCSTVCCPISLKNAMRLVGEVADSEIFVLHRDMMTPGKALEDYYRRALSRGVLFIRYGEEVPPQVKGNGRAEAVEVWDATSGVKRRIEADLVVLSTPLAPHEDNRRLAEVLGVSVDQHGFFSGNDPMHPLETNKDGVLICGSARWPVSAHQAIAQGEAAAVKAASILRKCGIEASSLGVLPGSLSLKAEVNPTICSGCGSCVSACPFEACYVQEGNGAIVAAVDELKCKGCGSCVSVCPNGAIQIPEESSSSIFEMLTKAFGRETSLPEARIREQGQGADHGSHNVVVFACRWCGLIGADGAGKRRISLPASFRLIPVECAARVESHFIITALAKGIDGVMVLGCHQGGCRYGSANHLAARRLESLKGLLDFVGIGGNRLLINWGTAHEPHQFAEVLSEFMDGLSELPPARFRKQLRRYVP